MKSLTVTGSKPFNTSMVKLPFILNFNVLLLFDIDMVQKNNCMYVIHSWTSHILQARMFQRIL